MASKDRGVPASPGGAASHAPAVSNTWVERGRYLLENEALSDVVFEVEATEGPVKIPGHRIILSLGSTAFEKQLFGSDVAAAGANGKVSVRVEGTGLEAFKNILRFLYTADCSLLTNTNVVDTLVAARKYELPALTDNCVKYIKDHVSPQTAPVLLAELSEPGDVDLRMFCLNKIARNPQDLFASEFFLQLNRATLYEFVKKETFDLEEMVLYNALCRWAEHACQAAGIEPTGARMRGQLGEIFHLLKFHRLTMQEILEGPSKNGLLTSEETVHVLNQIVKATPPPRKVARVEPVSVVPSPVKPRDYTVLRRFGTYAGVDSSMLSCVAMPHWIGLSANQTMQLHGVGLYTDLPKNGRIEKFCATVSLFRRQDRVLLASVTSTLEPIGSHDPAICHVVFPCPIRCEAKETYDVCVTYLQGLPGFRGTNGFQKLASQSRTCVVVVESCPLPQYVRMAAREYFDNTMLRINMCQKCQTLGPPLRRTPNTPRCECAAPAAATTEFGGQVPEFLISFDAEQKSPPAKRTVDEAMA